ncbi:MAG: four helix bundle protein [Planctomycetota bacterium]
MTERPHKKLKLWGKILDFIEIIYSLTEKLPKNEIYGLTSQMRRASISIASNLAEGSARKGIQEKIQFFPVAKGSLSELDAQLEISLRLRFIKEEGYNKTQFNLDEISRMLQGLINSLKLNN